MSSSQHPEIPPSSNPPSLGGEPNLAGIRAMLNSSQGPQYWRSLQQIARAPASHQERSDEFPPGASEWPEGVSRRGFLKLAAASLALGGLPACTKQPIQEIYPYVNQPPELVLGEPLYYATSMLLGGFATGALVKSREGHPIKVDGNPDHPSSLGGSSIWLQASILDLYDPDRSQSVLRDGELSTWGLFLGDLNELLAEQRQKKGAGLRFLTETITSPTLAAQLRGILEQFPLAKWHQYEPVNRDNVREGSRLAFGEVVETHYNLDSAAVILSLESDFLYTHPERLRYSRQFADARRLSTGKTGMNRLYVVESSPSVTGAMADHRLPLGSSKVAELARLVAKRVGLQAEVASDTVVGIPERWLEALAADLKKEQGKSVVIAGEYQPPIVHALAHLLNEYLGNVGKTVFYTESAEANPINQVQSLRELASTIQSGAVEALFILGGNPVYACPMDVPFEQLLTKVRRSIYLGSELDETAARCSWHIPAVHYLESWGDARSFDGTVSLIQPLIAPLYDGKSAYELLGTFVQQQPVLSDYEIVRNFWRSQNKWPDFEKGWRQALHNGFIPDSASRRKEVRVLDFDKTAQAQSQVSKPAQGQGLTNGGHTHNSPIGLENAVSENDIELCFRPDPSIWDGRFANNGWLQECPRPISKLTWGNAAFISPALAQRCRLKSNDVVELKFGGGSLRAPVWVLPGQADKSITLHLGYGRSRVGRVGTGVGFNAYKLWRDEWNTAGAQLLKTTETHLLVSTQTHHELDDPDRQVFRGCKLSDYLAKPQSIQESVEKPQREETLYNPEEYPYTGYKWGMSIDLTSCLGCNACLLACQTENNIPFVGKDQVHRHREMFWIRVDTYFRGSPDNPGFAHMPVPCMHCEHAPCELVCPVEATVHDQEGLNLQVYNRCVGTRFCSNNCPYKVRRFNFFQYTNYHQPSYKPMYNPEVTVRWRGVMEKCSYCIQRISTARITAEKENRRIREGEIKTACQQACPANAIVFGDLNLANSRVTQLKQLPLDYSMLGNLNTRPRTTYLAKVENPNPQIEPT